MPRPVHPTRPFGLASVYARRHETLLFGHLVYCLVHYLRYGSARSESGRPWQDSRFLSAAV
jgi:hypothetical protein